MGNNKNLIIGVSLVFLEVFLLFLLFSFIPQEVLAGVGSPNVTSITELEIANSYPEIQNISINDDAPIVLIPNSTIEVQCIAIIVDYNGDTDIVVVNATFFDASISQSNPDDKNDHYTNSSCQINRTFESFNGVPDDIYTALSNCTFRVEYYANPGNWNCTIEVNDTFDNKVTGSKEITVSELLAFGLPDVVDYGTVNATSVSNERVINITNYGNTKVNLSLEGYGVSPNDGNAMNCTLGLSKNISAELEKYNLTISTPGPLSLSEFEATYINLTTNPITKQFELASRTDDVINDVVKESYWRIYVPKGVAGTCTGNIVFGATTAVGN